MTLAQAARARVLIVEDEWLLADLLEEIVRDLGFDVAGPVPSVAQALDIVRFQDVTIAMLDVSLGGEEKSFPVARLLKERNIPFVFLTGHLISDLPPDFATSALLSKPLRAEAVGMQLRSLLSRRWSDS